MVRIWSIVIVVICIEQTHGAVAVSLPRLHPGKQKLLRIIGTRHFMHILIILNVPDYPGQCYDVGGSVAYAVGDHYPASRCERVICRSDYSLEWQT